MKIKQEKLPELQKISIYNALEMSDCSGEYRADINKRSLGDDSCPYCDGRRTKLGINSLIDTHPFVSQSIFTR